MAQIDDLLRSQARRLDALTDAQVRAMVRAFDAARRELREELERAILTGADRATPWTAQRTRVALALAEQALRDLSRRLGVSLDEAVEATADRSLRDLLAVIRAAEPEFGAAGGGVAVEALSRMSEAQGLALHRYSLERYTVDTIDEVQRRITTAAARGDGLRDVVEAVAGVDGVVASYGRPRAALIARMETSRSYNDAHLAGIESFAELADEPGDDDQLLKRIVEIRDDRNHPASRVAHGLTARPDEPFRLSAAAVLAEYRRMFPKRQSHRISGMVWPREGAVYVGMAPPIHFNDRSRVVPWRESWASG